MNEQEHQRLRVDLGAYVLGQLSTDEATELERPPRRLRALHRRARRS